MKTVENGKWEKISECTPSDQFICTYGGNFAQKMLIDRPQVEKFLSIAALDGRVLLQESKVRRPQVMPSDINPDGSVAGRGSLRWGQKIEVEDKKQNPYFQVEPDEAGWVISINGNLIREDLEKKGLFGLEMARPFADKFRYLTSAGLREALLKDKFTFAKDPYVFGRLIDTYGHLLFYKNIISGSGDIVDYIGIAVRVYLNYLQKDSIEKTHDKNRSREIFAVNPALADKILRFLAPYRKTALCLPELFGLSLETDRVLFAYFYLDYQKLTRNPLITVDN